MKLLLDTTLSQIAEAEGYHERAPEFGERAWRIKGRFADIIYWDLGNGWCDVFKVIPKEGCEDWVQQFFDKVEASKDF